MDYETTQYFFMETALHLDGLRVLRHIFTDISAEHTASNVYPEDGGNTCLRKSVNCSSFLLLYSQRKILIVTGVRMLNLQYSVAWCVLTLYLRRSRTGTVWFYTSTSNKRAARPKLYTKSLTRDLKRMYIRLTLVRITINL